MASATASAAIVSGVHRFTVVGHSLYKDPMARISSMPFAVGGYEWVISYHPNGGPAGKHISVFLYLRNPGEQEVPVSYSFSLQDPESPATEKYKATSPAPCNFSSKTSRWGFSRFLTKANLDKSGCLKNDRLVIKCTVDVLVGDNREGEASPSATPPSNMHQDVSRLLETGVGADTTVTGGGRTFMAHHCVLAARSPVLRRQLSKRKKSKTKAYSIDIKDMDARAVEALLHFMYNDSLPRFMDVRGYPGLQEARSTAQQLLAAADRYAMERLKLICEDKLMKTMDAPDERI